MNADKPVRLLIVDDQPIVIEHLHLMLEGSRNCERVRYRSAPCGRYGRTVPTDRHLAGFRHACS